LGWPFFVLSPGIIQSGAAWSRDNSDNEMLATSPMRWPVTSANFIANAVGRVIGKFPSEWRAVPPIGALSSDAHSRRISSGDRSRSRGFSFRIGGASPKVGSTVSRSRPIAQRKIAPDELEDAVWAMCHLSVWFGSLPRVGLRRNLIEQADHVTLRDLGDTHRAYPRSDVAIEHRDVITHGTRALVRPGVSIQPFVGDLGEGLRLSADPSVGRRVSLCLFVLDSSLQTSRF